MITYFLNHREMIRYQDIFANPSQAELTLDQYLDIATVKLPSIGDKQYRAVVFLNKDERGVYVSSELQEMSEPDTSGNNWQPIADGPAMPHFLGAYCFSDFAPACASDAFDFCIVQHQEGSGHLPSLQVPACPEAIDEPTTEYITITIHDGDVANVEGLPDGYWYKVVNLDEQDEAAMQEYQESLTDSEPLATLEDDEDSDNDESASKPTIEPAHEPGSMYFKRIPLADITCNPGFDRGGLDTHISYGPDNAILLDSINNLGVVMPITVYPIRDGKYKILPEHGSRRLWAVRQIGKEDHIVCMVVSQEQALHFPL